MFSIRSAFVVAIAYLYEVSGNRTQPKNSSLAVSGRRLVVSRSVGLKAGVVADHAVKLRYQLYLAFL